MSLEERIRQLEEKIKELRPDLGFPSTATLEQRVRWLEIVVRELVDGNRPELLDEERIKSLPGHTVYVKPDRVTLHSLTADPSTVNAGDVWFRSDLGKAKLAVDAVAANAIEFPAPGLSEEEVITWTIVMGG